MLKFNIALLVISLLLSAFGIVYELVGYGYSGFLPLGVVGILAVCALEWVRRDNLRHAIAEQQKMLRG